MGQALSTDVVAAFDFDGTLTRHDTLTGFLRVVAGTRDLAMAAASTAALLVAARLDHARRDDAKAALLRRLLAGRSERWLRDLGRRYADRVVARNLRPDTMATLVRHREQRDDVVIVSASLALYLEPVGELLGAKAVLATEMEVDVDGCLTGELARPNVRGAEKVRRLDEWLGSRLCHVVAYGDSTGDHELLARADEAVRV